MKRKSWSNVAGTFHVEKKGIPSDMPLLAKLIMENADLPSTELLEIVEYDITIGFLSTGTFEPAYYGREWGDASPEYSDEEREYDGIEVLTWHHEDGKVVDIMLCDQDHPDVIEEIWNHYEDDIYKVELDD
jgi:hypothetical protein